ncbi:MAG: hypothetical protein ACK55I_31665, partial [bacterium]
MDGAAEGGLREHHLRPHPLRVGGPRREPVELASPQQLEPGQVDRLPVVAGIGDMIGARTHRR